MLHVIHNKNFALKISNQMTWSNLMYMENRPVSLFVCPTYILEGCHKSRAKRKSILQPTLTSKCKKSIYTLLISILIPLLNWFYWFYFIICIGKKKKKKAEKNTKKKIIIKKKSEKKYTSRKKIQRKKIRIRNSDLLLIYVLNKYGSLAFTVWIRNSNLLLIYVLNLPRKYGKCPNPKHSSIIDICS